MEIIMASQNYEILCQYYEIFNYKTGKILNY